MEVGVGVIVGAGKGSEVIESDRVDGAVVVVAC